ncbi:MAG TPA: hypothetical protein VIT91_13280 [Chthoniobacterales bacterium]
MRKFAVLFALLVANPIFAQLIAPTGSVTSESGPLPPPDFSLNKASTVIHPDDSKTVTVFNAEKKQSDVTYYNSNGSWRAHIIYTLDEQDRVKFGQFLNQNGTPGVRALYRYDENNRVIEERHFAKDGSLVRRMSYEYGLTDRVMKTVAFDKDGNVLGVYTPTKRKKK